MNKCIANQKPTKLQYLQAKYKIRIRRLKYLKLNKMLQNIKDQSINM